MEAKKATPGREAEAPAQDSAQKTINARVPAFNSRKIGSAATVVQPGTGKIISMVQNTQWPTAAAVAKAKKAKKKLSWQYTTYNYAR